MSDLPKVVRERLQAAASGNHPDSDLLTAFAEQALPERERTPLLEHLARCADCRDVLALASVPAVSAASQSKDTAVARKAPWFSFPVLRWGALAACVVIVGTAVVLYRDQKLAYTTEDLRQVSQPASAPASASVSAENAPAPPSETKTKKSLADHETAAGPASIAVPSAAPSRVVREKALTADIPAPNQSSGARVLKRFPPAPAPPANTFVANNVRDDRHTDAAYSTVVDVTGGAMATPVPVPAAPVAKKDSPSVASSGRSTENRVLANERVQREPLTQMVDTMSADSDKSDKKVEVPGRAKTSGATTNALVVAPSDELNLQKSVTPYTAEMAKVRKERSAFSRAAGLLWNISSGGQLQRSADSGKSWQPVSVAEGATFRALTFNGPDVWVGGAAGSLYHSSDAGGHWTRIKPAANNVPLSADIAAIAFTDPQHGKVTTTNGQTWITADGGQSWIQQP